MPGYIIAENDSGLIYGVGDTADAAWLDADDWGLSDRAQQLALLDPRDGFSCLPATDALLTEIMARGGDIARGRLLDGTACTLDEEAAAIDAGA